MISETGFVEIIQAFILISCIILCVKHTSKSRTKSDKYFWFSSVLIFISALRRELSHIPYLFISEDALFLGKPYAWWEDGVLLIITLAALWGLYKSRYYVLALLKSIPLTLYIFTAILLIIQYISENHIGFSIETGAVVEEICEIAIFLIAAMFLWRFNVFNFESSNNEL